jgi:hypothetical protein
MREIECAQQKYMRGGGVLSSSVVLYAYVFPAI